MKETTLVQSNNYTPNTYFPSICIAFLLRSLIFQLHLVRTVFGRESMVLSGISVDVRRESVWQTWSALGSQTDRRQKSSPTALLFPPLLLLPEKGPLPIECTQLRRIVLEMEMEWKGETETEGRNIEEELQEERNVPWKELGRQDKALNKKGEQGDAQIQLPKTESESDTRKEELWLIYLQEELQRLTRSSREIYYHIGFSSLIPKLILTTKYHAIRWLIIGNCTMCESFPVWI